jgi:hypothetical protein
MRTVPLADAYRLLLRVSRPLGISKSIFDEVRRVALLIDQLRQTLRRLGKAPLFTAIILITLAVGIGANTVVFSVVEGVLLKPLRYPQP